MKFSLSWLKDFVDMDVNIHMEADGIGDLLTSLGLEVASIDKRHIPQGIKVARVLTVDKHPNADKLHVCTVDAGEAAPLTIVCGAPNVDAGMLAPLATIGTKFSNGFEIAKAKLRGVESFGMLCSEKELGLSDDHSGLLSLPQDMTVGSELSAYFPDDCIFDVELTPNRGDCLSVLGIAREVSAKLKKSLKNTAFSPVETAGASINDFISVAIDAPEACPRYGGRLVRGVKIGPSPQWIAQRLADAGVRPINNVVDITNYMMLHFGQPMHAFDYNCIGQKKIVVRFAAATTVFTTLDRVQRTLAADDLLICDGEKPVALAGIMGGAGSEISDATTDVFLECAYFSPGQVRKTSKRLGLSSESSYRFERGVDPGNALVWALDNAADMLRRYAGGTIVPGRIDAGALPLKKRVIGLRPSRVNRLLGVSIPIPEIEDTLERLQISCEARGGAGDDALECSVPLYRHDISCEADLIEEVGRFYGYDNIPSAKEARVSLDTALSSTEGRMDAIRSSLAFMGLHEIMTNSLTSEKKNTLVRPDAKPVTLLNPLSPDMAQLRTSMLSAALEVCAYNINRKSLDNRYFEIGRTYESPAGGGTELPRERDMASVLVQGNFLSKAWNNTVGLKTDFYVMKGILDKLAANLGVPALVFTPLSRTAAFESEACSVSGPSIQGSMGKIRADVCAAFDIKDAVYYAELDITDFLTAPAPQPVYKPLPKYPALERDFCFVLSESVGAAAILSEVRPLSGLIEDVTPFDVYRGEKLGKGLKSIAFSVRLRSPERTLVDKEAEDVCGKIVMTMEKKFDAALRST
jgi:phenylalanyl-tRNA synthetase beta chain